MNNNILNNSNSSNSNISNSSSHLAQLNHQLNNLQVNQAIQSFHPQTNGQIIQHQQLVHHNAQLKYNREFIENLLEGDLILQVKILILALKNLIIYIA